MSVRSNGEAVIEAEAIGVEQALPIGELGSLDGALLAGLAKTLLSNWLVGLDAEGLAGTD